MASFKVLLIVLLATVFMFLAPAINAKKCSPNGTPCQPDGRTPCCTKFCYKQKGWKKGVCSIR